MAKKKAKPKSKSADAAADGGTFEESLAELETVVAALESGELGLDDALQHYETGVTRLKHCHELLGAAEQRIAVLSGVDADGNPVSEPFEGADGESLGEKAGSRARRRSREAVSGQSAADVDDSGRLF